MDLALLASVTIVCVLAAASGYRVALALAALYGFVVLTAWFAGMVTQ